MIQLIQIPTKLLRIVTFMYIVSVLNSLISIALKTIVKNGRYFVQNFFHQRLYILDVLWGQPIKLAQVASTSELRKNQ